MGGPRLCACDVLVPKANIGDNMGYFAIIREGNRVGLHSTR